MDQQLKQLLDDGLGDFRLQALQWSDNGEDLKLTLRHPGPSDAVLVIRLVWVTRLALSLDFGEYAGFPLVWGASLQPLPQNRWAIQIQFSAAPEGSLACECNEIRLDEGVIDA